MAMPPCGTFSYVGVIPDAIARTTGQWELADASGAPPPSKVRRWWEWGKADDAARF